MKAWNPNHWATREFLIFLNLSNSVKSRAETVITPFESTISNSPFADIVTYLLPILYTLTNVCEKWPRWMCVCLWPYGQEFVWRTASVSLLVSLGLSIRPPLERIPASAAEPFPVEDPSQCPPGPPAPVVKLAFKFEASAKHLCGSCTGFVDTSSIFRLSPTHRREWPSTSHFQIPFSLSQHLCWTGDT